MCQSVIDHEWDDEVITGAETHPVVGRVIHVQRQCLRCDRVQRSTRRGLEPPCYGVTLDSLLARQTHAAGNDR
jgi:bacterioferritin-associated ferredoxin